LYGKSAGMQIMLHSVTFSEAPSNICYGYSRPNGPCSTDKIS